jgi:hypothetical protein
VLPNVAWNIIATQAYPEQSIQPVVAAKRLNNNNTYTWAVARDSDTSSLRRSTKLGSAAWSSWSTVTGGTNVFSSPGMTSWQGSDADSNRNVAIAFIESSVSHNLRIGHSNSGDATNLSFVTVNSSSGNWFHRPALAWASTPQRLFVFNVLENGSIRFKYYTIGTSGSIGASGWSSWTTIPGGQTFSGGAAAAAISGDIITVMGVPTGCGGACTARMIRIKASLAAPDPNNPNWTNVPGGAVFNQGVTMFMSSNGIGGGGGGARVVALRNTGVLWSTTSPSFNSWDNVNNSGCTTPNEAAWAPVKNNGQSMFVATCGAPFAQFSTMN